jgi:hypothetical protein
MKRGKTQTCSRLKVTGDKDALQRFVEMIVDKNGDIKILHNTVPIPGPSHEQTEFWGAIFGDYATEIIRQSDTEIVIEFWSYYDPLVKGLTSMSMLFPELTFTGAFYTTLKATLGRYKIEHGQIDYGELNPKTSLEMKNFCCDWDDEIETKWFSLADNWIADMIGEPLPA